MQTIIRIDPAYERCGYAVIQQAEGHLKVLDLGVIKTNPKDPFPLRLQEIGKDFAHLLQKYEPDLVAIEDLFFVNNITTGLKVAEVRGVLTYLATDYGCRIHAPKPVEVKHAFTGHGKATKQDMIRMAHLQFDLGDTKVIDDAIDALAVGFWALRNQDFS